MLIYSFGFLERMTEPEPVAPHIIRKNYKPDKKGKAVQLYIDDNPYLVLGSSGINHTDLLSSALRSNGVTLHPREERIPPTIGDRYRVAGMSQCSQEGSVIEFFGSSSLYVAYGIDGPDQQHLDDMKPFLEAEGLEARIGEP